MNSNFSDDSSLILATRGSDLALAQSHYVRNRLTTFFPDLKIELAIFKTTGDKIQTATSLPPHLPKGLFTKELELALLEHRADLAVHSLKDLPTEMPKGLALAGVSPREDVREILLTKTPIDANANFKNDSENDSENRESENESENHDFENPLNHLPNGAQIGTGSARREAFLKSANASFRAVSIRGNVPTRIKKLAQSRDLDGIVLAAAGLHRLGFDFQNRDHFHENGISIFATFLPIRAMIPCVGQAAIGLQTRRDDLRLRAICTSFTDESARICVETERTFLALMGGGCQSPIAALATINRRKITLITANAASHPLRIIEDSSDIDNASALAKHIAARHLHHEK